MAGLRELMPTKRIWTEGQRQSARNINSIVHGHTRSGCRARLEVGDRRALCSFRRGDIPCDREFPGLRL